MCEQVVCVRKLCVSADKCVDKLCVSKLCVRKLCVGRRRREEAGVQNRKQEPHTKMWGKNEAIPRDFLQKWQVES